MTIKNFVFNPFQVNTYVLYDTTKECIIIDPACSNAEEFEILKNFISENGLKPVSFYNTHSHIDHLAGNAYIKDNYNINLCIHKAGLPFLEFASAQAASLGFTLEKVIQPDFFIEDGDTVNFGNASLKVIYTPGHADGSVCFYAAEDAFIIVGDVLFQGSIGRTDLPTGHFELLERSIKEKLYTLPDNVVVYTGHGPSTTIGNEKRHNPFVKA